MPRFLVIVALFTMPPVLEAQEPVKSPTQAETLAKWPWSISLQPGQFKEH
jgi:hypothetical protein